MWIVNVWGTLWRNGRAVLSVNQVHTPPERESFITTNTAAIDAPPQRLESEPWNPEPLYGLPMCGLRCGRIGV